MRHSQVCLILPAKYSTFDMSDADSWLCAGNGGALGISAIPVLRIHQIFITFITSHSLAYREWPTLPHPGLQMTCSFMRWLKCWEGVGWGQAHVLPGHFLSGWKQLSGEQTHDFNFISTSLQLIKLTIQSAPRTNTRKPRAKWIWRGRPSVYILNKPLTTFHALLREPSEPLAGHLTHSL